MQVIKDLHYSDDTLEEMFSETTGYGQGIVPTEKAILAASKELEAPANEISWKCPDVFDIRYGSSYAATAFANGKAIRFHSTEGDFREGDDK